MLSFEYDVIVTSSTLLPVQAAYRNNTLGLPNNCPEENINKITVSDVKQFLSSHYLPSRMVLTGVNVDHDHLVDLAQRYFVNPSTSWEGVKGKPIDQSISQYTSGEVKVCCRRAIKHVGMRGILV